MSKFWTAYAIVAAFFISVGYLSLSEAIGHSRHIALAEIENFSSFGTASDMAR